MRKLCIWTLAFALLQANFECTTSSENQNNPRSLLKDPIDEEHDDLASESAATHAYEWTVQIEKV